jgi:hypothetical protein
MSFNPGVLDDNESRTAAHSVSPFPSAVIWKLTGMSWVTPSMVTLAAIEKKDTPFLLVPSWRRWTIFARSNTDNAMKWVRGSSHVLHTFKETQEGGWGEEGKKGEGGVEGGLQS